MSYVIYEKESTLFVRILRNGYWQDASYKTEGAAKAAFNRMKRDGCSYNGKPFKPTDATHAIAERGLFHATIEKKRMTRNILNPDAGEFEIPVNTPAYMDPGCESYHSM